MHLGIENGATVPAVMAVMAIAKRIIPPRMPPWAKRLAVVVLCSAVTFALAYFHGTIDVRETAQVAFTVSLMALGAHQMQKQTLAEIRKADKRRR